MPTYNMRAVAPLARERARAVKTRTLPGSEL
jgi:hypothetical protein